jgi:hypothetical protein
MPGDGSSTAAHAAAAELLTIAVTPFKTLQKTTFEDVN